MKASWLKRLYPIAFAVIVAAVMLTLLALTESSTRAALEARGDQQTLEMLREIFSKADYYIFDEDTEIYTLYNSGRNEIGYAFYAEGWGYRSEIVILVGLEDKETIEGITVVSQYEDYAYWYMLVNRDFFSQFVGLKIEDCALKLYSGGGKVDGVTGATVSSKAITDSVKKAALEKVKYLG